MSGLFMHKSKIEKTKDEFRRFLKERGYSYTPQRRIVIEQMLRNGTHFDVDDLIDDFRKKKLRVSRATVYRTIGHLEEGGFIRRVDLDQSHAHYEVETGVTHHEHLVCRSCGSIIEVDDQELEEKIEKIALRHGFQITRHQLKAFGLCRKCHSETRKQKKSGSKR